MSLTSRLQALLTYANEKTEAGDTTIGAAIKTLCDGYSGASGSATYPTITDADTLSSRIQALIAYADDTTGEGDATLAEAIKRLAEGYGSVLPSGYTECEYLQSKYAQYIDTGITPYNIGKWTLVAKFNGFAQAYNLNGCFGYDNNRFDIGISNTSFWIAIGSSNTSISRDFDKHTFILDKVAYNGYIDNKVLNFSAVSWIDNKYSVLLFARNYYGSGDIFKCYENIYSSIIQDSDYNITQNLIPCLDADGTPCMYDTVSKQPFYNQGSGTFGYKTKDGVVVDPT